MGQIKAKKGGKGGVGKIVKGAKKQLNKMMGKTGGGKHRRMTPERLAKKILVEKLKKKLFKMKYGGR